MASELNLGSGLFKQTPFNQLGDSPQFDKANSAAAAKDVAAEDLKKKEGAAAAAKALAERKPTAEQLIAKSTAETNLGIAQTASDTAKIKLDEAIESHTKANDLVDKTDDAIRAAKGVEDACRRDADASDQIARDARHFANLAVIFADSEALALKEKATEAEQKATEASEALIRAYNKVVELNGDKMRQLQAVQNAVTNLNTANEAEKSTAASLTLAQTTYTQANLAVVANTPTEAETEAAGQAAFALKDAETAVAETTQAANQASQDLADGISKDIPFDPRLIPTTPGQSLSLGTPTDSQGKGLYSSDSEIAGTYQKIYETNWNDFQNNPNSKAQFVPVYSDPVPPFLDGSPTGQYVMTIDRLGRRMDSDGTPLKLLSPLDAASEQDKYNKMTPEEKRAAASEELLKVRETPTGSMYQTEGFSPFGLPNPINLRDSIHGQVGQSHYSTADDPIDPDPIQGTDVDVWVERYQEPFSRSNQNPNEAIRNLILLGSFQEIAIKISSKALRYYEVDSRAPILLDDEWLLNFTLGKGLIDMEVLEQTFGLRHIHQLARFNRLPRLKITFNSDPRSLDPLGRPRGELNQNIRTHGWNPKDLSNSSEMTITQSQSDLQRAQWASLGSPTSKNQLGNTLAESQEQTDNRIRSDKPENPDQPQVDEYGQLVSTGTRYPIGRWVLEGARCNELLLHAAGSKVIQNQWHGEAEALRAVVFNEPAGDNMARSFRPEYRHWDVEAQPKAFRPRHYDGDLGPAAHTRDPWFDVERKKRKVNQLVQGAVQDAFAFLPKF